MEENSLTIAILREIRDEVRTTRTDLTDRIDRLTDRVDHLTDRVGSLESLTSAMAAVQITQAKQLTEITAILREHSERFDRHEVALLDLVRETRRIHDRIDNIYEGPVSSTLRDHETRIRRLEGRDD